MLSRRCQSDEDWHQVSCHSFPCQSSFCRRRGCGRLPRSARVLFRSPSRSIIHCDRARRRASERASERGRQRVERGRRQGGGSRERGGSAQREAGEAPANAERARLGRRRSSVRPPSAQPRGGRRLAFEGRGRASIVRVGGGPRARGPGAAGGELAARGPRAGRARWPEPCAAGRSGPGAAPARPAPGSLSPGSGRPLGRRCWRHQPGAPFERLEAGAASDSGRATEVGATA